jgi:hypothetical protein
MWAGRPLQRAERLGFADRKARHVIVFASSRTDIPAFYAAWFMARLREPDCRLIDRREAE